VLPSHSRVREARSSARESSRPGESSAPQHIATRTPQRLQIPPARQQTRSVRPDAVASRDPEPYEKARKASPRTRPVVLGGNAILIGTRVLEPKPCQGPGPVTTKRRNRTTMRLHGKRTVERERRRLPLSPTWRPSEQTGPPPPPSGNSAPFVKDQILSAPLFIRPYRPLEAARRLPAKAHRRISCRIYWVRSHVLAAVVLVRWWPQCSYAGFGGGCPHRPSRAVHPQPQRPRRAEAPAPSAVRPSRLRTRSRSSRSRRPPRAQRHASPPATSSHHSATGPRGTIAHWSNPSVSGT